MDFIHVILLVEAVIIIIGIAYVVHRFRSGS